MRTSWWSSWRWSSLPPSARSKLPPGPRRQAAAACAASKHVVQAASTISTTPRLERPRAWRRSVEEAWLTFPFGRLLARMAWGAIRDRTWLSIRGTRRGTRGPFKFSIYHGHFLVCWHLPPSIGPQGPPVAPGSTNLYFTMRFLSRRILLLTAHSEKRKIVLTSRGFAAQLSACCR